MEQELMKILAEFKQKPLLPIEGVQQEILSLFNKRKSNLLFSGWRPFIGWSVGATIIYVGLFRPIINGFLSIFFHLSPFQELSTDFLLAVIALVGGFGAARSWEKKHNIETKDSQNG